MQHKNYLNPLQYRIFQLVERSKLLKKGDKIVVAFSGGVDSLFLLRFLQAIQEKLQLQLLVVHFDHDLRPESQAEAKLAAAMAQGEQFLTYKAPAFPKGENLHKLAREWRRGILLQELGEHGFDKIALGHHLDDLVETQIFRLLRGSSLFSLNPMQLIDGPWVRPLLREKKCDLQQMMEEEGESWIEDPSNQNPKYSRSQVRHQVIPILEECSPGSLQEKFLFLAEEVEDLKQLFDQLIPRDSYQSEVLPYAVIQKQPQLIAKEMVHRFLLFHGAVEVHRSQIQEITQLMNSGRGGWKIDLKGVQVQGLQGILRIHQINPSKT